MELETVEALERLAALPDAGALTDDKFAQQMTILLKRSLGVPVQPEFRVALERRGDRMIQVIKVVRGLIGLDLKETKAIVDNAPMHVLCDVDRDTVERAAGILRSV